MKWSSLLNDIKDKIGLQSPASTATSTASSSSSSPSCTSREDDASSTRQRLSYSSPSNRDGLEVDFKRFWEVFRSSKLEKEKEAALIMTVDAFCKLMKQHSNVTQLVTMLVETHVFSFVVGRAFVTDIEKLKISSKTRTLGLPKVLQYFSEVSKDGIRPGANLLTTVGVLVSSPIDQQSLLDSGIFCCLIHVFNTFLSPKEPSQGKSVTDSEEQMQLSNDSSPDAEQARQLEVEGSVVHIMKALASHASAAQSLIEDDSLTLLFQMVANGSLSVFSCYKEGLISLHNIQLHRHAMQILGLLLANDSGSTAKYIQRHNLIKVLLMAIKHFNSDSGDPAYTVGIADLLLQCVELSYRPEAGGTRLRDDIHNAHGHHFLVQFALVLSSRQQLKITGSVGLEESNKSCSSKNMEESSDIMDLEATGRELDSSQDLSPTLCRLLDMLVNLSQTGPVESKASKSPHTKNDETWEHGNTKIKDLEAVQMLQDIFLKANNSDLQAEVLNRLFKILSSHLENYKLCQQLRTVPLLILNMSGFPKPLQDIVLKILEYAVTVVSCVPEQELLSLCCLLQQPITSELKHTILSFFIKLLSFDQQYKKVLREVGVLEVLLDDLKHHKSLLGSDQSSDRNQLGRKSNSSSFKKHWDTKDVIIPSAKLMESGSGKFPIFEAERTISIAWDFLLSLLKKAEGNQSSFRSAEGVATILPFLMSETHRPGALRIFSCLITEDNDQAHPEELGGLVEVLKSGVVTSISGYQYKLQTEAICDTMGALWRIMGLNKSAQRVFGEATGFSLLLTTLHRFKDGGLVEEPSLAVCIKLFAYLLRLLTAAVCGNAINRTKLHAVISSQAFNDVFSESALLCVELEKQVIQLLLELALEVVVPPFLMSENANSLNIVRNESVNSVSSTLSGSFSLDKERVYNAGAIRVLLCSLLHFSPSMQLEVLDLIENLARVGPFNQDSLTSVGCVELVLKIIHPFLSGSSQLLVNALKIVEVLGAYRLSSSELQVLIRYIVQMRQMKSGHIMVEMMERLILTEDMVLENVPLAPFLEMDMRKVGHASIQVSLGDRSWPPAAGYSFTCWFQFRNHFRTHKKDTEPIKAGLKTPNSSNGQHNERHFLRLFSVGAVSNDNSFYVELYLQDNGVLTLSTSNSSSLSFSGIELEEGKWHHLAVVHSKPNALAGLFQPSIANVYLDGKLKHAGKLGYSPSPIGKSLHVVIGTPITCARVSDLTWRLRSCHLFEEVLTPGCICFIYMLGSGYRGLFQDLDLLRFIPDQACGGSSMAILESMDADLALASSTQKVDNSNRQVDFKADGSEIVWDLDRLRNLSIQLSGRKLIFAFDGTFTEAVRSFGTSFMLNLVDPLSAAASPIGGIPRFGRLHGDIYICKQCVIGDTIQPVGGMVVVLALVEAAESREMLHMALSLLACALHQNPQNVRDMQTLRGYHLLALFLHRRMSLFDTHCLEIFFQIAACEASFSEPNKLVHVQTPVSPAATFPEASFEDINFSKFPEDSSVESHSDVAEDFYTQKDSCSHMSEIENTEVPVATSNCIVLSNADMVEYVLLDWTLWVTAQVPIQVALLGFLEQLVSMHWYRNHNLTILREISLVQHLLVTLQRADVEVPVLEKLVVLLRVILEDGFLTSEVDNVVRFVIMTFDPPELKPRHQIIRESIGKHIIVRNMLLEMLIELQVTIKAEEILEQWYKNVSSKLLTYFLDEAVHPTSMRCIMTLLGVSLTTSPTFALKFRTSGRYQSLMRILPSFYDSPDVYYILFCLVFGKPVYPRLPEVRMLDFHALMPCNGDHVELKFVELLDSIISMAKSTFDRLMLQLMLAQQTGNPSQLVAELIDQNADTSGELQGEALMHKTYAARLMGGEASAPAETTSILRFMVDLAKICPTFSAVCRRTEFLEGCIDLYFSCCRAAYAVQMSREISLRLEEKSLNDCNDANSRDLFSTIHPGQEESANASISMRSSPQAEVGTYSDETPTALNYSTEYRADVKETVPQKETFKSVQDDAEVLETIDGNSFQLVSSSNESSSHDIKHDIPQVHTAISSSSSSPIPDSTILSERSSSKVPLTASSAPVVKPTSLRAIYTESKSFSPIESFVSATDSDATTDLQSWSKGQQGVNSFFPVSPELLLKVDDLGYGGGPCSAGGTAVLDFIAEVLADILTEQLKATQTIENNLEMLPLYVETDSMLVFQGLCLSRLMIFLERRLLRDDEEDEKKLDKSKWSSNLDAFCWLIVDRVYMGAFPQPTSVLRTLEFLLSMLQLANKDGRIEEAAPAGKGILSMGRGSRQLDAYIQSILKNTNRMVLYCFLPSFLTSIGENDLLLFVGLLKEANKQSTANSSQRDSRINTATVLQLLVAHRPIIFCPSNLDADMNCCLCINLIPLTLDGRCNVQNMAIDIIKYLILHRKTFMEDLLISKLNQGQHLDVLHGGFDKLLTENLSAFLEWFQSSEHVVTKVLEQNATAMWNQYVTGAEKFPGVRIKGIEARRKKDMDRRSKETVKLDLKHWEQATERRNLLVLVRDEMSTELRVVRQDKYGWVLHAESEWQTSIQQLVHKRGIFPLRKTVVPEDPEWLLCPIEGPYRMRKKLEPCKIRIYCIQDVLDGELELGDTKLSKTKSEDSPDVSRSGSGSIFNHLTHDTKQNGSGTDLYIDCLFKELDDTDHVSSVKNGWNDDRASSTNEASLHSGIEFVGKSNTVSVPLSATVLDRSVPGSPWQSSSAKAEEATILDDKSDTELNDNGEYLIRPYLEPLEKIRCRYNCERVLGLDKQDGIFLIGELCLYVIENLYIDDSGCICEKEDRDELSVIDQALGVKKDLTGSLGFQSSGTSPWSRATKTYVGARAWAYNNGARGKQKACQNRNLPHPWRKWKLDSVHEILKRDYQLRPVAIEVFSMDGCNDLLVFLKREREEVFKNLVAMNLPRNSMLDTTISGSAKQENNEGSRLFKLMAKSFSKRWQNGEISNFQYLMHLNTLAGRGYRDLTQYPVFPWVLADYESENLDLSDPNAFRKLDKPMGCQTPEGAEEFKKRYDSWDDPEVPQFHYGSHYSSAGIVLFYLLRLPPFSSENQKLQGGQFDHADRLFNNIRDTWLSAAGKSNTSDVKELIPEFFYMPEFLENRFNLDLGEKQSGEKVGDVILPPWAKGSTLEFIRKHRKALESNYVSEHLHHWIDLIFGYKQRGKAAEEAVNVFYHYTYEGSVDIDSVNDPAMKASILAQINHFGQTPKQLFRKPHVKRWTDRKLPTHPLRHSSLLIPREIRKHLTSIREIVYFHEKILIAGGNRLLKPRTYTKYIAWGFPDRSLRFMSCDQDRLISTHESLHGLNQITCADFTHDGHILVTGADDGLISVWRISQDGPQPSHRVLSKKALCAHTAKVTCLYVSQPYMLIASGSDDCTVILWDLSSLAFVRQLPEFPAPVSAVYVNDLSGEIVTAAGVLLAVWSINGDCLSVVNKDQVPLDVILCVTSCIFSDWLDKNWYVTGHQSGAVKVWHMVHPVDLVISLAEFASYGTGGLDLGGNMPEYMLMLHKVLNFHKHPVTSLHVTTDLKQFLSGDSDGHLVSWTLPDESFKASFDEG